MPSFYSPSLSLPHLGPSSRLRLDISRPFVPHWIIQYPWKNQWSGSSRAGRLNMTFLVLLGHRSLGYTQLLEALVNQQTKYERGQDPQPEGGSQGPGTAH